MLQALDFVFLYIFPNDIAGSVQFTLVVELSRVRLCAPFFGGVVSVQHEHLLSELFRVS